VHELGEELFEAFNRLSSSRGYGMGGALPVTIESMAAYCHLFEITDLDERAQFIRVIQQLDHTYIEYQHNQSASGSKSEVVQ